MKSNWKPRDRQSPVSLFCCAERRVWQSLHFWMCQRLYLGGALFRRSRGYQTISGEITGEATHLRTMSRHHTRLNPRRWALTRRQVFMRDGYRCRKCGKRGRLEAHHIVRLEDGGAAYDPDNCETMCRFCHIEEHRTDTMTPGRSAWRKFVSELTG